MKDKIKYLIILALACLGFMIIDDVSAKTTMQNIRISGNYFSSSSVVVSSFDFYTYTTIPANVYPVINGFVPYFDGIPNEYILKSNSTTYLHFRLVTNVAINMDTFGDFLDGITIYSTMGDLLTLEMVYSTLSVNKPVITFDFYVRYTCPGTYSECRIGNGNMSFLNLYYGTTTSNPYYVISSEPRYFGTILDDSYVEVVTESYINKLIESNKNKEILDSIDKNTDKITGAINGTNDKLDDINDTLTDSSIDTDTAGGFFSNFDTEDNGGLSAVITAPLKMVRKATSSCEPLTLQAFDKDIELPCGDTLFWGKPEVAQFRTIWNTIFGGAILFMLLRHVFKTIENVKDPQSDKVEVMKL